MDTISLISKIIYKGKSMGQLVYQATRSDANWLRENYFIFSRTHSDEEDKVFIHRFPVYKGGNVTTLEAEMRLHTINNKVTIDVYDGTGISRGIYAPFYYRADSCHDEIVDLVNKKIQKECDRLGMVANER